MKEKIYISGKMSGLSKEAVIAKFSKAEKLLEASGFEVINAIKVINDWDSNWYTSMKKCIKILMDCNNLYLLKDYEYSSGALLELEIAKRLNFKIYYEPI